jgi:hypothetical protein
MEVDISELKKAVEIQHGGIASFIESYPIVETFKGEVVWRGVVQVFELSGHPSASRCYAWSSPIEGSEKRRFFAVLHQAPVASALEAVRAAIVQEHRQLGSDKNG